MYCSKCGNKLNVDQKFCQNCGTPVGAVPIQYEPIPGRSAASPPTHQLRGKMIVLIVGAIGAMFIGALATYIILNMRGASIKRTDDIISKSTDDIISKSQVQAANAFASAIASDDFETAIALFGCGRRARSQDLSAYVERMGSWYPGDDGIGYPSGTDIFTKANQTRMQRTAAWQIQTMLFSLNVREEDLKDLLLGTMKMDDNGEGVSVAELAAYCSPENLDTFKVLRIDYTRPDVQNEYASKAELEAASYGGRIIEDYTVLYEYNGKTYLGGMEFIQYEDGWYIYSTVSMLSGQGGWGLTEMSKSEYAERVETSDWDFE